MISSNSNKSDNEPKSNGQPDVEQKQGTSQANPWKGVKTADYVDEILCNEGPSDDIVEFTDD